MFRGSCPSQIDLDGRLQLPEDFRHEIDRRYDGNFFVTLIDHAIVIYPMSEWEKEKESFLAIPDPDPETRKLFGLASSCGEETSMDTQGRLALPELFHKKAGITSEVFVVGMLNRLEIRDSKEFKDYLRANPLSEDDLQELERLLPPEIVPEFPEPDDQSLGEPRLTQNDFKCLALPVHPQDLLAYIRQESRDKFAVVTAPAKESATEARSAGIKKLACAELRGNLARVIDGMATGHQSEHMRNCKECRDLVSYIRGMAEQAKQAISGG